MVGNAYYVSYTRWKYLEKWHTGISTITALHEKQSVMKVLQTMCKSK